MRIVNLTIQESNFTNNSADFGRGGLFYLNSHMMNADIVNATFIRNRMNFKNYSGQDAAIFYLDSREIGRFNLSRSNFETDPSIRYTLDGSNKTIVDNDYYQVLFSKTNSSNIIISDSIF